MKKTLFVTGVILCSILSCELVTTSDNNSRTITALKIKDGEVSGWEEIACSNVARGLTELTAIINGGADEYINQGMVEGFLQKLGKIGTDGNVDMYIMDFGTSEKAEKMFSEKIKKYTEKVEVTGYSPSIAQIDMSSPEGAVAVAHFQQYYFELTFMDFGAYLQDSKSMAESLIETFNTKVTQIQ